MSASEFYYACRNGELDKAKELLASMSTTAIDHVEPNGSTALHAAAYYGHIDIVRLLLDKGASLDQKNKYNQTPDAEARTPEVAQILHDYKIRLAGNWMIGDMFSGISQHRRFYSFNQGPPTLSDVVHKLLNSKELWFAEMEQNSGMDEVRSQFEEALRSKNAAPLVCAYTMDSSFYRILNKTLANHNQLTNEERENPPWFCAYARFLASDEPTLRSYRWMGITYRGMSMHEDHLNKFKESNVLMNKKFLSTSKLRHIAEMFAKENTGKDERGVLFRFIIEDNRAALDASRCTLQQYEHEQEVIILPCMDFEIIHMDGKSKPLFEITLLLR